MNKRFLCLILDGFGIGAMEDAAAVRNQDIHANTLRSLLMKMPDLYLPELEKLGLMNAYGFKSRRMSASDQALYGYSDLLHQGADTYMGHQEIMGSWPKIPVIQPFQLQLSEIKRALEKHQHEVQCVNRGSLSYLIVDHFVTVADNIDADYGMAYNVTAPLDQISFEKVLKIAQIVRSASTVNRVIAFGGEGTTVEDLLNAEEVHEDQFIGIHAVRSGSYKKGYQVRHLGFGVNINDQVPHSLFLQGVPATLIGKVADIVENEAGRRLSCVNTSAVMEMILETMSVQNNGLICANVQETDLAGHSQNADLYAERLQEVDQYLVQIKEAMTDQDLLLICADHGNDPEIGHHHHTRERVPLLLYGKQRQPGFIGHRKTLSDIGATICDFFDAPPCANGTSFLQKCRRN